MIIVVELEKYLIKICIKLSKKAYITILKKVCGNGEQILLKGLGNFNINTMKNDDLIFVLNEQEHHIFKREK